MSWKRCWPSWRDTPPLQCRCLHPHCTPVWCHRLKSPEQKRRGERTRWKGQNGKKKRKAKKTGRHNRVNIRSHLTRRQLLVVCKCRCLGLSVHSPKDPKENTSVHPSHLVTSSTADAAYSRLDDCQHSHTIHTIHTWLVTKMKVKIRKKVQFLLCWTDWLEQIRNAREQLQHLECGVFIVIQMNK